VERIERDDGATGGAEFAEQCLRRLDFIGFLGDIDRRQDQRDVGAAKGITVADDRTQALIQKTTLASLSRAKSAIERPEVDGVVSWRVCQVA
jgi:hypothetical protein